MRLTCCTLATRVLCDLDLSYYCQAGEPQAVIQWFKDEKELYPGDKYDMCLSDGVAKLNIRASELPDDGSYRIVAKNKVGEISSEAHLTVYSKCTCSFISCFW